jgi:hypothetical protein
MTARRHDDKRFARHLRGWRRTLIVRTKGQALLRSLHENVAERRFFSELTPDRPQCRIPLRIKWNKAPVNLALPA